MSSDQKILNQAQAEAVYSAMCYLNNVGGKLEAAMPSLKNPRRSVHVIEIAGVGIQVCEGYHLGAAREEYTNQSEFATAYGLQQG